jgi:hypothetical protein
MQASDEVAGVVTSTSVQLFATMSVTEGAIASPEPLNVERAFSHPLSHVPFRCKRGLHHIMSFFHALANPVLHASHCRLVRLVTALQVLTLVEYLLCIQIPFLYILFPISKSPTFHRQWVVQYTIKVKGPLHSRATSLEVGLLSNDVHYESGEISSSTSDQRFDSRVSVCRSSWILKLSRSRNSPNDL